MGGGTGVKLVPLSYVKLMQRLWILRRRGVYGGTTMQPIWGVACMIPGDQGDWFCVIAQIYKKVNGTGTCSRMEQEFFHV